MAVQLRVSLNAPTEEIDATRALGDLRSVLDLLGDMERSVARDDLARPVAWRFSELRLGSVSAVVTPDRHEGHDAERPLHAGLRLVQGFAAAETANLLPASWSPGSARKASVLASHLGTEVSDGLTLELLIDGQPAARAAVTSAAGRNLRAAIRARQESIGSLVGTIGSLNVRKRRSAGIWPERGGGRIEVTFSADQLELMAAHLGQRVQMSGRLLRNDRGQLIRVKLRRLEALSGATQGASTIRGVAPGITGGMAAVDYVRSMRDSS